MLKHRILYYTTNEWVRDYEIRWMKNLHNKRRSGCSDDVVPLVLVTRDKVHEKCEALSGWDIILKFEFEYEILNSIETKWNLTWRIEVSSSIFTADKSSNFTAAYKRHKLHLYSYYRWGSRVSNFFFCFCVQFSSFSLTHIRYVVVLFFLNLISLWLFCCDFFLYFAHYWLNFSFFFLNILTRERDISCDT